MGPKAAHHPKDRQQVALVSTERNWDSCSQRVGVKMAQSLWKTAWPLLRNLPYHPLTPLLRDMPCSPAVRLLRMEPREVKALLHSRTCTQIFMATFTIAKRWKEATCPSSGKRRKTMQCTHPGEYCSTVKRNEVLICTAGGQASEISCWVKECRRPRVLWFHLYEASRKGQSLASQSRGLFLRAEGGTRRLSTNRQEGPFGGARNMLKPNCNEGGPSQ